MIQHRLNQLLKAQNMNGCCLANKTELSEAAISRYRSGKRNPRPTELRKIAQALGVRVSDLFNE